MGNYDNIIKAVSTLAKKTPKTYNGPAEVLRVEGRTAWVHIPGGVPQTPAEMTIYCTPGDTVQIMISGHKCYVTGNVTSPPTDDTKANEAKKDALDAMERADGAQETAEEARASARSARAAADAAWIYADEAADAAEVAQESADAAQESASEAKTSAKNANDYAARALGNLSTVQSVAETLTWITQHGTMTPTTDTELDPTHVYFVADPDGDYQVGSQRYAVVADPDVADIGTYYQLSIDESLNNYVGTHLALTSEGLWLIPDSANGNRVLISTGSAAQADISLDINGDGELVFTNHSGIPVAFELDENGYLSYSTGQYETVEFSINGDGEIVMERAQSPYDTAGTYIIDGDGVIVGAFLSTLAQIGPSSGAHTEIDANGQRIYASDGSTLMAGFSPSGSQIGRLADWHVLLAPSGLSFEPPTGSASEIIKILAGGNGYGQLLFSYEDSGFLYETYLCNGELYLLRYDQDNSVEVYASLTPDGLTFNDGTNSVIYGTTQTYTVPQSAFSSEFRLYNTNVPVQIRKSGNTVAMTGCVQPTQVITGSNSDHVIFTIPSAWFVRPPQEIVLAMQGGAYYKWCLKVKTNGEVTFSRFSAKDAYADVPTNGWLPFHATWII